MSQLLIGCSDSQLKAFHLTRSPDHYFYTRQGHATKVDTINDRNDHRDVNASLNILQFDSSDQDTLWRVVAAILHLGNVEFTIDQDDKLAVKTLDHVTTVADLLHVERDDLNAALCERVIAARGDILRKEHTEVEANYGRDALAKAIYERLFGWIVDKINKAIAVDEHNYSKNYKSSLIGVLDIYGFEIFDNNSFEQFCINYCNEKLQQLFIGK